MRFTRLLLAIFAAAASALCGGCHQEQESAGTRPAEPPAIEGTVVAVGDSLTAGYGVPEAEAYPAQLEQKLHRAGYRWRVVNAGIGGETSSGTLSRVAWILQLKPDIVILETGANDGLRGIDPKLAESNIDKTVTALQEGGAVVILAGMRTLKNFGPSYGKEFAAIYPRIAARRDLILIPFFLTGVAGEAHLNQEDGLHPLGEGYGIVAEEVYPYLLRAIELKRGKRRAD